MQTWTLSGHYQALVASLCLGTAGAQAGFRNDCRTETDSADVQLDFSMLLFYQEFWMLSSYYEQALLLPPRRIKGASGAAAHQAAGDKPAAQRRCSTRH